MLLSGKQKKEKKEDKKKTTRDGKIEKRNSTDKRALKKAMGSEDFETYKMMLRNFDIARRNYQTYQFLVAGNEEDTSLLEELLKLRAEIIAFLASVVIKRLRSKEDDKRKLVEKARRRFEKETNSIDKLSEEQQENEKDPEEPEMVKEKPAKLNINRADVYLVINLNPDGTFDNFYKTFDTFEPLRDEIKAPFYGHDDNKILTSPITKWLGFLQKKIGYVDDAYSRNVITWTLVENDDYDVKERKLRERNFLNEVAHESNRIKRSQSFVTLI